MLLESNTQKTNMSDELLIDSDILETNETESDADDCNDIELEKTFTKTYTINSEKALTLNKTYILHISCTRESVPKICAGLSNNTCEIYNVSSNQINKVITLDSHKANIINVKFSSDCNLLYTGSSDCKIKLWDLRTNKNVLEFTDINSNEPKPLVTFDVSPNNRVLCGGSELCENDAYLMFWDIRNAKLLGGYWESHTDDVTKVLFHPSDNDKLATGSTDGLINIYDLKETNEDDALMNSINTDSSVEQLLWYGEGLIKDICCVTHTVDVQLWDTEEATPLGSFNRDNIAKTMKRKSAEHTYIANAHLNKSNEIFLITGSNWHKGECVRSINIKNNNLLTPYFKLNENKQRIRSSWFNEQDEILITGGEQCILNVWKESASNDGKSTPLKLKNKKITNKPY